MYETDVFIRHGRRDRNMQDKHGRIFQAAAALFEAHGYAGVTTQVISERADVGTGTLDWDAILPAAKAAGVEWFVVEHDFPSDPLGSIRASYDFLAAKLA